MVLSGLGFLFFFYIFLICAFDPDRFHIKHYHSQAADKSAHVTAWTSAAAAAFIYLLIGGILFLIKYNDKEELKKLKEFWNPRPERVNHPSTYELSEFHRPQ